MNILVAIKRAPLRDERVRAGPDGAPPCFDEGAFEINPFDEVALEAALRLRDRLDGSVTAVSHGPVAVEEQLRSALAMGADRAVRVEGEETPDGAIRARALASVVRRESPDLVVCGKLAADGESAQVPAMLAECLGWPVATAAVELEPLGDRLRLLCRREQGDEEVEIEPPAVVSVDLALAEPRYVSLAGVLRARARPVEVARAGDELDGLESRVLWSHYQTRAERRDGRLVASPEELLALLCKRGEIGPAKGSSRARDGG